MAGDVSKVNYENAVTKSALQAKFDAQKIAFGPIVFQAAKAMRDLGILDLIRKHKARGIGAEALAESLGLSAYGVRVLLELGLSAEVVRLNEGRFVITKTGFFLLSDDLTRVNMNFVGDVCYRAMSNLQDAISEGKPCGLKEFGNWNTIYEALSRLPDDARESWLEFNHYYSDLAFPLVMDIVFKDNPKQIIDVGGNTGQFSILCAARSDDVSIQILDLPGQLELARRNIERVGLGHRIEVLEVDFLADDCDIPPNADVIWMSQFLDCFAPGEIGTILNITARAMAPESSLFILETLLDRQRFEAAAFCLHNTSVYFACLANGNSKMYDSAELFECINGAGLEIVLQTDDIGIGHTLLECRLKA